jgi:outer membrane protein OmpA-like peptidoglycan-associated protein
MIAQKAADERKVRLIKTARIITKKGVVMEGKKVLLFLVVLVFVLGGAMGSATGYQPSYFGVQNRAFVVPPEFEMTKQAIARAEKSAGVQYCPEKLEQAKATAKEGAEIYWSCRSKEGLAKLAEARRLAQEAEQCSPPPKPVAKPTPPPPPPPKMIKLEGVHFAFDSAQLTPEGRMILDEQTETLMDNPGLQVEIAGHTDAVGTDEYNQDLSERRAQSVKEYLVSKGVGAGRLKTVGYGESRPIASNITEEGRAENRRVELKIIE